MGKVARFMSVVLSAALLNGIFVSQPPSAYASVPGDDRKTLEVRKTANARSSTACWTIRYGTSANRWKRMSEELRRNRRRSGCYGITSTYT